MYNSCQEYTSSNNCDPCAKSLKISQLKSQLVQLEEDDKAYNDLLQKYRQLQNEYQLINEAKLHLEYELRQKNETTNKILNDLKAQNMDLTNELNEKENIYKKLYADNTNLFRNLEERKKENENFCKVVEENENMINHITQDKAQCEHDAMLLNETSKKNENDIQNLCNQLENLKLKSRTQNDELTKKNLEMNNNQKCLNEVKNDNANLNNQINLKISSLDTIQKQLTIANQSIVDMQNELNNLEKSHSLGLNQLENIKINFKNEHEKRVQAENDNVRLEGILKDKEDNMNKLSGINGQLKADRDKLVVTKNKLLDDLDKYKNHIMILTEQTEKLTDELQRIIDEDSELYNLNNAQIQRLQKVIYENKKMLSDEIAALNALENYVRNQTNYGTTLNQSVEQNRKTYSINNNQ
jgi:predicted  nucleic acid-binding Zn-ribbon protein